MKNIALLNKNGFAELLMSLSSTKEEELIIQNGVRLKSYEIQA
jgi:hypothetical protein